MFGFTRVRQSSLNSDDIKSIRIFYCGLCHALRQEFGLPSGLLAGRDALFLVLLGDAQWQHEEAIQKTRCPARFGLTTRDCTTNLLVTRYAAAISVLLVWAKLEDDIEDEGSLLAKGFLRLSGDQIANAFSILESLQFDIPAMMALRQQQYLLENSGTSGNLLDLTEPSAQAVAMVVGHTAILADKDNNREPLISIGKCLGRIITVLDACEDFSADTRKGQYNLLARFDLGQGSQPLKNPQSFHILRQFLLIQLREIRTQCSVLNVNRHFKLLSNILNTGLFDATTKSCKKLVSNNNWFSEVDQPQACCDQCGKKINGYFCQHCGSKRLII